MLRIAILGSFPMYPYQHKVHFLRRPKPTIVANANLAKGLAKIPSAEVHVITLASLWKAQVIEDERLNIHFLGKPPRLDLLNRITRLQFSKLHIDHYLSRLKPDIVHGIGTEHIYAYIAVTSKFPHVITLHGVISQVTKKMGLPRFSLYHLLADMEIEIVKRTKYLIAINEYVLEQFAKIFKGKAIKIENAVHPIFFEIPSTKEEYDLAFVGMFDRRKRLLNLIQALEQVQCKRPNVLLKVIGATRDPSYFEEIKIYIRNVGLQGHVEFLGQLSQEELALALSKARVLVLPSIQETAPLVISEAQVLGKPVVATDVGGVRHMVDDGETGFVVPADNIVALADKISILLEDANLRRIMGLKAKERAQAVHHPDIVAQKTMDFYLKVLNCSGT